MRQPTCLPGVVWLLMRLNTAATLVALGAVCGAYSAHPHGRVIGQERSSMDAYFVGSEVYFLSNGHANALAVVTADGVVLLDAMSAGWSSAVLETLQRVTYLPVTTIINTHAHDDHAGADSEYPEPVQIAIHENGARRLAPSIAASAVSTFSDRMPLTFGSRRLYLYYFGKGHTDADTIVVIPDVKAAFVGDLFAENALPIVDRDGGGSALALPETLTRAAAEITGVERIITGHGESRPYMQGWPTWDDFREYAEFTRAFVDAVTAAWENGKTAEQATAELQMPEEYTDYRLDGAQDLVETIFDELRLSR